MSELPRRELWHGTGCYNDARYGASRYGSSFRHPSGPQHIAEQPAIAGVGGFDTAEKTGDSKRGCDRVGVESWSGEVPLIVTGHQCQFFHCGVLLKYLLLDRLAELTGGVALNIAVDSDLPKHSAFEVPVRDEGRLTRKRIRLAHGDSE